MPAAVLWLNYKRQLKRFEIIADNISNGGLIAGDTLADIGCGYGAFFEFLHSRKDFSPAHYYGLDISTEMIKFCRKTYNCRTASFLNASGLEHLCSFSIISGTFNRAATSDLSKWENYVFSNLLNIWHCTQKSMIFNMQFTGLKESLITNDMIYYIARPRLLDLLDTIGGHYYLVCHPYLPNDMTVVVKRT